MTAPTPAYIGRFAPSPTGPLHFGSLVAATGSYLDARAAAGQWLLRIEDIDAPRTVTGAAEGILATLERFGFEWDAEPVWQSARLEAYQAVFERLRAAGDLFPCACSRSEMADSALARDGSRIYPGTCRDGMPAGRRARAWRIRAGGHITFEDRIQGHQQEDLARDVGDYVVLRADGQFAYQLAVVADDADAGVSHVVRGSDLLGSTGRQIHLQHRLGYPTPAYAHLPVVINAAGEKLSKQTLAAPVDAVAPTTALLMALNFLGQNPPDALRRASLAEIWTWAVAHWRCEQVPKRPHAIMPEQSFSTAT